MDGRVAGSFMEEDVESCSSTTKKILSPQPDYLRPPYVAGW